MRIISLLLVLITFNLSSQEIKRVDSENSFINYTGKHFLHKWSAENKNISGLIQIDGESISNIGIVAKVQDFKSGNSSVRNVKSLSITTRVGILHSKCAKIISARGRIR